MPGRGRESGHDKLENYPEERGSARLLGVTSPGVPVYYNPETHAARRIDLDGEGIIPDWDAEEVLPADTTVGDVVERIEEEVGWDALTAYADEQLPDELVGDDDPD